MDGLIDEYLMIVEDIGSSKGSSGRSDLDHSFHEI